ncbi:phage holin family protein [Facklamia miroungae]|uniref:Toxin secretion/phage lysis holin n=1 Tax=Facklamia miroungae TaxID=120956 RepID=A0A1G7VAV6_9LACT|nr:phage holin family protein [Facklamia miroungae]NKZ30289.1 phage holin family protein [Facklamia miroungae]SDG56883.1 toxin secretion/phage lysis holin [Facklamia miroungae]
MYNKLEFDKLINIYETINQNPYIVVFVWLVVLDFITGYAKSFIINVANSTKGLRGLVKHLLVVILVISVCPLLTLLGFESISLSFIVFYIGTYGISIVENIGQSDIPLPTFGILYFEKLNTEKINIDSNKVIMINDHSDRNKKNKF